jgi:hypothetical protein
LTMQEQKQKAKRKSYQEILDDVRAIFSKTAAVYIPEMCRALKEEQPGYTNSDIQRKIEIDLRDINTPLTIYTFLPPWMRDDKRSQQAAKAWETKNQKKIDAVRKNLTELKEIDLAEPPKEKESYEGEDLDLEGGRLATYGEKGRSISGMKGNITYHGARLFEALTESDHLPYNDEDLIVDYIKPSREHRKSFVLELDEQGRKTVWNCLGAVQAAVEEMLDLLEEEMKK